MRARKLSTLIALLAATALWAGCGTRPAATTLAAGGAETPSELEIKIAALGRFAAPPAAPLKSESVIKKGEGGEFIYPASLAASADGGVYLADNNGHAIHYRRANEPHADALPIQSGGGKLLFPTTVREHGGNLFVSDNEGIKVFGRDGKFQRLLRTYYGIFDFVVARDGSIYASVTYNAPKDSDPLIVKLDATGKRVGDLGRRRTVPQYRGLDERVYLHLTDELLIAAYKHRPVVQVYNLSDGALAREFNVSHPAFAPLDEIYNKGVAAGSSSTKTFIPRYIAGVSASGGRLFVLLHLPRPEIVELDLQGRETNRYRNDEVSNVIDYFGFDVRAAGDRPLFYTGVCGVPGQEDVPFLAVLAPQGGDNQQP